MFWFWANEGDWHKRGVRLNILLGWFMFLKLELLDGLRLRSIGGEEGFAWF